MLLWKKSSGIASAQLGPILIFNCSLILCKLTKIKVSDDMICYNPLPLIIVFLCCTYLSLTNNLLVPRICDINPPTIDDHFSYSFHVLIRYDEFIFHSDIPPNILKTNLYLQQRFSHDNHVISLAEFSSKKKKSKLTDILLRLLCHSVRRKTLIKHV